MAVNPIKVWNGTAWEYTGPVVAAPPVKYQATAPTSPATGDVWVESDYDVASVDPSKLLTGGVYTNESTRSAAIPTPTTGMVTYVGDTGTDSSTIPQIETYTGSAWQTPYGMTQVANVSFTAAATVTIDNAFTTAYDNYRVVMLWNGTNSTPTWVLRAGGADQTANSYRNQRLNANGASITGANASGTSYTLTDIGAISNATIDFISPRLASSTQWNYHGIYYDGGSAIITELGSGLYSAVTACDGFKITSVSGTLTGTIRIYGYRNS
jgi:hypothetical protein